MSIQLALDKREVAGKKLKALRAEGLIPSVVYGGEAPVMTASVYNDTERVLLAAGYHSPVELTIAGKKQLAIVKNIDVDPVSRRIVNVEFQAISADEVVEATTPIKIVEFEASEAAKKHFVLQQVLEEIDVKARPADLPEEILVSAKDLASTEDKLTIADLQMPKDVKIASKEISENMAVATVYDPAVEAAAREAEEKAAKEAAAEGTAEGGETATESAEASAEGGETKAE